MNETLQFLETVLPPEGDHWYVAAVFRENRVNHRFFRNRLELAAALVEADARAETVYHAVSVYRERAAGRKASNAKLVSSFWTDIDAGERKQYATAASAQDAILQFCNATGLPRPLFVCSGFGIHVYWPLAVCLDPETWKRYSAGLANLLRRHGIKNERTTDLASLLRPPGTHNRKHATPAPVTIMDKPREIPYQLGQLERLLDVPNRQAGPVRSIDGHSLAGRLALVNVTNRYRRCRDAFDGCQQLSEPSRDGRGYVPQTHWYAGLGVFAYCDDGDEFGHEWSQDDDRYDERETQRKLDQVRANTTGATTCAFFHELNPQTCEACPHWQKIKSPIALCTQKEEYKNGHKLESITSEIDLPELPEPYQWRNQSLCLVHENKQGEDVEVVISKHPIYLAAVHTRESKDEFAYQYRQLIPTRGWHDIVINASVLHSGSGRGELSQRGANPRDFGAFVKYTTTAIDMQYSDTELSTLYEQFGWKDQETSFLYGLDLYTKTEIKKVVADKNVAQRTGTKDIWVGPCKGGDLSTWSATANKLFAAGTEAQSVAICASFGAVFHRLLSRDEGGAIISLVTHAGGRGKSTALAGALSVWGKKLGLSLENIDSSISRGATLASIGNLPLFYDEFETCDPWMVRDFIRMFTEGRDKRRMGRDGAIKDHGMQWQTTLFTASNASLIDSIVSIGNEALSSRIWEMSTAVPDHLRDMFAGDKLKDELGRHSGHAGAAFLSKLMAGGNLIKARHELDRVMVDLNKELPDTTLRYWKKMAATVAVAAEIITSGDKLVSFVPSRIMEWLIKQMKASSTYDPYLLADGGTATASIEALGEFMAEHNQCQLVVSGPFVPGTYTGDIGVTVKPTRQLYIRKERNGGKIYIAKNALRAWCVKRGINMRELIADLERHKICLHPRKNITLGAGTDYTSLRVQCVEIDGMNAKVNDMLFDKSDNVLPFEKRREPNSDEDLELDMPY